MFSSKVENKSHIIFEDPEEIAAAIKNLLEVLRYAMSDHNDPTESAIKGTMYLAEVLTDVLNESYKAAN